MKVIVAGSRHFDNKDFIYEIIKDSPWPITELVHGGARGVDTIAGEWANDTETPVRVFHANWEAFGTKAGPIRNTEMANYADALIAIMFDSSRGTASMVKIALAKGLQILVINVNSLDRLFNEQNK